MSGFGVSSVTIDDPATCEDSANLQYVLVERFAPSTPQHQLNLIWESAYWMCIEAGGRSNFTANP